MTSGEERSPCLNCGEDTGPAFCPHCGQEVENRQGPLLEVGREVLSDWLSLDSRLLRSLRALLRPGHLSELYLAGKRTPYLRPFRLYLLASLALFSTLLTLDAPRAEGLDLYIGGELVGVEKAGGATRELEFLGKDRIVSRILLEIAGDRVERVRELPPQEILEMLFVGFRGVLPSTLILFVPFLALALKLLYIRGQVRHTQYLDHLVFALHYQSALFLVLTAAWLVTRLAGAEWRGGVLAYLGTFLVMILVYLPWALRRFYGQSRAWTAVKTVVVLFAYSQLLGFVLELSAIIAIWET
jgi:hypothetical protein